MLSPEEIKAKLVLKKITQARLAEECGISRSQFSTIITKTQSVLPKLSKILGENPFEIQSKKVNKKSK
ncbi:helix-turn-helix transcriptional regulator [bacterium]|nr:helix-turn-helix transcriptional regulator [bacterium]